MWFVSHIRTRKRTQPRWFPANCVKVISIKSGCRNNLFENTYINILLAGLRYWAQILWPRLQVLRPGVIGLFSISAVSSTQSLIFRIVSGYCGRARRFVDKLELWLNATKYPYNKFPRALNSADCGPSHMKCAYSWCQRCILWHTRTVNSPFLVYMYQYLNVVVHLLLYNHSVHLYI